MASKTTSLTVSASVKDGASGALREISTEADRMAAAQVAAGQKLVSVSGSVTDAQRGRLSATKAVTLAVKEQRAAGDPLKLQMVQLERTYLETEAAMRQMHRRGEQIPPGMAAQAAAARDSAAAFKLTRSHLLMLKFALAAASAAVIKFAYDFAKLGDNLDKSSKKIGLNTKALQLWRRSAELAGGDAAGFDKALIKLSRAVGEARDGTAEYVDAFEKLGIDRATLQHAELADILPLVADGMKGLESNITRAQVATDLLGAKNAALIPMFNQGAAAIAAQATETERLGLITQNQIDLSAVLTDETRDLEQSYESLKGNLFEELAPTLITTVEGLTELAVWTRTNWQYIKDFASATRDAVLAAVPFTASVSLLSNAMKTFDAATSDSGDAMALVMAEMKVKVKDVRDELADTYADSGKLLEQLKKVQDSGKGKKKASKTKPEKSPEELAAESLFNKRQEWAAQALAYDAADLAREEATAARKKVINDKLNDYLTERNDKRNAKIDADLKKQEAALEASALKQAQDWAHMAQDMGAAFGQAIVAMTDDTKAGAKIMLRAIIDMIEKTVMGYMVAWATAAGSAVAGVPVVGPALAVGAASAAFAVAKGYMAKFADGGVVTGGREGEDSVPALLTPGEVVFPVPMVRQLRRLMGMTGGTDAPQALAFANGGAVPQGQARGGITVNLSLNTLELPTEAQLDRMVRDRIMPSFRRMGALV